MIRISIIILFLFSCTQKTKVPENVLPPHKMEKVLLDLLRADEFYNLKQADSSTMDSFNRINLYQSVFALHKTNKPDFQRSFIYYENHPDLLKVVLDSMYSKTNKSTEVTLSEKKDSVVKPDLKLRILQKNKRGIKK